MDVGSQQDTIREGEDKSFRAPVAVDCRNSAIVIEGQQPRCQTIKRPKKCRLCHQPRACNPDTTPPVADGGGKRLQLEGGRRGGVRAAGGTFNFLGP